MIIRTLKAACLAAWLSPFAAVAGDADLRLQSWELPDSMHADFQTADAVAEPASLVADAGDACIDATTAAIPPAPPVQVASVGPDACIDATLPPPTPEWIAMQ